MQVRTKNQYTYKFDEGSYTVTEDSIYGSGRNIFKPGSKFDEDFTGSIPLKDIESFKFDRFNTGNTLGVITVIAFLGGIIALVVSGISSAGFGG